MLPIESPSSEPHRDPVRDALHGVVDWFTARGLAARVPGGLRPPPLATAPDLVDAGTLFVEQRVELKYLDRPFTSRADWPFGAKFVVGLRQAWETASPRPYAVMVVNSALTHVAVVKAASRAYWTVERQAEGKANAEGLEFYLCPMEHVEFIPLTRPPAK